MLYDLVVPPFLLDIRNMPLEQLHRYRKWFIDSIADRIEILHRAVTTTEGYEQWKADLSPVSLQMLGKWFAQQVEGRVVSQEATPPPTPFYVVQSFDLTTKTFSLAFDIGVYLGQTFLAQHPNLYWTQDVKKKRYIDYGHVVLAGFGAVPLNPVRLVTTLAYGLLHGRESEQRLAELYEIWEKMISKNG